MKILVDPYAKYNYKYAIKEIMAEKIDANQQELHIDIPMVCEVRYREWLKIIDVGLIFLNCPYFIVHHDNKPYILCVVIKVFCTFSFP